LKRFIEAVIGLGSNILRNQLAACVLFSKQKKIKQQGKILFIDGSDQACGRAQTFWNGAY
jgi:type I restriction-modification system DNA methylase subunit